MTSRQFGHESGKPKRERGKNRTERGRGRNSNQRRWRLPKKSLPARDVQKVNEIRSPVKSISTQG